MLLYELMANNLMRSTGGQVQFCLFFKQVCFGVFETLDDLA
jgi:hypothetical protein